MAYLYTLCVQNPCLQKQSFCKQVVCKQAAAQLAVAYKPPAQLRLQTPCTAKLCKRSGEVCVQTRSRYAAWFVSKRSGYWFVRKSSICLRTLAKLLLQIYDLQAKLCLQKLRFCTQKLRFCKTCGVATQHPWDTKAKLL